MTECKYCEAWPREPLLRLDMGNYEDGEQAVMTVSIWDDDLHMFDGYLSMNAIAKIKYCPMCGRKLNEN